MFINLDHKHYRRHTDEKPYACEHCEFRSNSPSSWSMHMKSMHDVNKKFKKPWGSLPIYALETVVQKFNFQIFSKIFIHITPQDTKLYSCVSCEYKTPQKDKFRCTYKGYPLENKRFAVSKMWIQNCNQGSITTSHYFNLWLNQKASLRTMWSSSISNSKSNKTIQRCP